VALPDDQNRSIKLLTSIMEEISMHNVVIDDEALGLPARGVGKLSWRAIRRSILPSPELASLRVRGGNHRGFFSSEEIASLAEEEEREKIRKLKDIYVVPGEPFQKYNITDKSIGKGGVGEVFFAENGDTKVAIKKLQIVKQGRDRLHLILREIEIIATSANENIVGYLETYQVQGELWVIMEYMSGGSLYDLVKLWPNGCRVDENTVAYCLGCVVKALAFLHSRKRIHRDIKVDNVLVSFDGDVKLADFGTAVQLTFQRLRRTTVAGTPYYMAPELIQRIPYREKVDIWSVGITIIELVTGRPPFYELDPSDALHAIVTRGTPGLTGFNFSEQIQDFVNNRCLSPDPDIRASATELLAHPFMGLACTKEEFAKFLRQTYKTHKPPPFSSGCTIL